MSRSLVRTWLIVAVLITVALVLRWAGSDWFMDRLASMHAPPGH